MGDLTSYDDFDLTEQQILNLKPTFIALSHKRKTPTTRQNIQFTVNNKNSLSLKRSKTGWIEIKPKPFDPEAYFIPYNMDDVIYPPNHKTDEELDKMFIEFQVRGGDDKAMLYFFQ